MVGVPLIGYLISVKYVNCFVFIMKVTCPTCLNVFDSYSASGTGKQNGKVVKYYDTYLCMKMDVERDDLIDA